jgi:hypothetical protein
MLWKWLVKNMALCLISDVGFASKLYLEKNDLKMLNSLYISTDMVLKNGDEFLPKRKYITFRSIQNFHFHNRGEDCGSYQQANLFRNFPNGHWP